MEKKQIFDKWMNKIKNEKKWKIGLYGGVIIIALIFCFTEWGNSQDISSEEIIETNAQNQSEQEIEERLEKILSSIRGAGQVKVMITYETGVEMVTAMSTDVNSNRSETVGTDKSSFMVQETESTKPATVSGNGGYTPIILAEKQPTIRGVIVVAEGAANISVKMDLQQAVQTILAVPANSVEVFELSKQLEVKGGNGK